MPENNTIFMGKMLTLGGKQIWQLHSLGHNLQAQTVT
jgi:hypothetical protein